MNIFLLGYMGCGKSLIGKLLSKNLQRDFIDMDTLIEEREKASISSLFQKKGEIYFRRLEKQVLKELINEKTETIISLGGGTPCYGNNMELITNSGEAKSIYLQAGLDVLTERLFQEKENRPVISHLDEREQLEEFLRKHLFERSFYYNQSDLVIHTDAKSPETIVKEIAVKLE